MRHPPWTSLSSPEITRRDDTRYVVRGIEVPPGRTLDLARWVVGRWQSQDLPAGELRVRLSRKDDQRRGTVSDGEWVDGGFRAWFSEWEEGREYLVMESPDVEFKAGYQGLADGHRVVFHYVHRSLSTIECTGPRAAELARCVLYSWVDAALAHHRVRWGSRIDQLWSIPLDIYRPRCVEHASLASIGAFRCKAGKEFYGLLPDVSDPFRPTRSTDTVRFVGCLPADPGETTVTVPELDLEKWSRQVGALPETWHEDNPLIKVSDDWVYRQYGDVGEALQPRKDGPFAIFTTRTGDGVRVVILGCDEERARIAGSLERPRAPST